MFRRIHRFILFLVGFSIPIQAESISLGPFKATLFKIVTALLLVLAGLQIAQRTGERVRDRKAMWVFAFGLSWIIALIMSIVAGAPAGPTLQTGSTMLALVAYYFLLGFAMRRREDLVLLLWALTLGGALTALPAVLGLQAASVETKYGGRFTGLSGQENRFGADMTVCMASALALFFTVRSKVAKVILAGCAAAAVGGVGLSLSRAAFLALASMWVFWLYRSGRVGALRWAAPAMLLGAAVLLMLPDSVEKRAETMIDPAQRARDDSIQGRFIMGAWALRAMASNPILGVGANRFADWVHEQPDGHGVPWHSIHNAFLSIGAEQGLMGLIPFIGLLALTWFDYSRCWRMIRVRRRLGDPLLNEYASYTLFLQMALLARLVSACFHQGHHSKAMWTIVALSSALLSLIRARVTELGGDLGTERASLFPDASSALPAGRIPAR